MLRVGTKVIAIEACDGNQDTYGKVGKIIDRDSSVHDMVLVEFIEDVAGHTGYGEGIYGRTGREGHCWWCLEGSLEKYKKTKVSTKALIRAKIKNLWNNSKYVQKNPRVAY